jgi:serine/threonine-protein kinase RsbW
MDKPLKLRLRAVLDSVPKAIDCVTCSAQEAGMDDRSVRQIQVAVDEACANVIHHAYAGIEAGDMEITCDVEGDSFVVRVRDWGKSFDVDSVPVPDVEAPLEERDLGGLGIFLIRQFVDTAEFSFDPELGNELVMSKRLSVAS